MGACPLRNPAAWEGLDKPDQPGAGQGAAMSPEMATASPIRTPAVPSSRWLAQEEINASEHLGDDRLKTLACQASDANSRSVGMF